MSKTHWMNVRTRFQEVEWEELSPGQVVYYYDEDEYLDIGNPEGESAYGPFVVIDIVRKTLKTQGGRTFNAEYPEIKLLRRVEDEPIQPAVR